MAELGVPACDATVRVRMVDTTGVMVVKARSFVEPVQQGHESLNIPVAAFLIENPATGAKVMFDLGVRKDYWDLPTPLRKRLGSIIPALRVDRDTTEILQEKGVALEEICEQHQFIPPALVKTISQGPCSDAYSVASIIWSHYHWDHTGSVELFPTSTELVVGLGFQDSPTLLPGFPDHPESPVDSRAFKGRTLTELHFSDNNLEIGGFRAHDFFGDGSFYLLDTPGHCLGHMCGLARTTGGDSSTFAFLGGDICHFPGCFRPSPQQPLPEMIPDEVLDDDPYFPKPCPSTLFAECHPVKNPDDKSPDGRLTSPFYRVSGDTTTAYSDPEEAQRSVDKLANFDCDASVLVCLAHDETVVSSLPTLNDSPEDDLNDWKARGYKDNVRWGWLNDLPRNRSPGRKKIVSGYWRDGRPWPEAANVLQRD